MFTVGQDIVVFPDQGKMVVRVVDPVAQQLARQLPQVELLEGENQLLISLPWCEDSCRMVQNIGVDATGAAPIWHERLPLIEGKYTPMPHQLFTAAFVTLNPRCYVLNDPRTGKTGSLILAADYMQKQRFIQGGVLIITTVTTIPDVWIQAIKDTLPGCNVVSVHGPTREKVLEVPAEFYVSNYDSCRLSSKAFQKAVKEGRIGAVFIDELTNAGNPTTKRFKGMDAFINGLHVPYVVGATGSPGDDPEMVFGMCKMINRTKLPCTTLTKWKELTEYRYGPEPYMTRPSIHAPEIIYKAMQPAVRFKKDDVLPDLPPVTTQNRTCVLSSEQVKMREQFKKQAIALLQSGEVITAVNGGVLHQKLMQVALGFVMDNNGKPVYLDNLNRFKVIKEAIEETERKVVIFGFYKAANRRLKEQLEHAGYTVGLVDGSVTGKERAEILRRFQYEKYPHICICNPRTTAFGTEMSAADTAIVDGPPPLGQFIWTQLLERLSSAKQTSSKINIIRIIGSPEEDKFFRTLDNGREMGNFINTLFEDYARGLL